MFSFGQNPFDAGRTFSAKYKCFSVAAGDREDVERGGKIIMPPSALDSLARLNIQYPMLFKLTNKAINRETHCGVLEFVAEEGRIYIPYWMMRNLYVTEGAMVQIENTSLSVATYAKFQPQSPDFLDITNPKAVLENALRNFACLTQGDVIAIKYNDREYELCVLETQPGQAVSIIECDMRVDFAPPVGYKEPENYRRTSDAVDSSEMETDAAEDEENLFKPFGGQGLRLDGKERKVSESSGSGGPGAGLPRRGIPNYKYQRGTISFIRSVKPVSNGNAEENDKAFEAFSGAGNALKKKRERK